LAGGSTIGGTSTGVGTGGDSGGTVGSGVCARVATNGRISPNQRWKKTSRAVELIEVKTPASRLRRCSFDQQAARLHVASACMGMRFAARRSLSNDVACAARRSLRQMDPFVKQLKGQPDEST
jgi:hypothetical protein